MDLARAGAVWTIVVAAGGGARYGAAKQFEVLDGVTVLDRSVATARAASDGVVVVLPGDATWDPPAGVRRAVGGATRTDSVRAGLALVPDDASVVVVHDAARPLASRSLFDAVVAAVRAGADAAVPGIAVADTVKRVAAGAVVETVPRDDLVLVQTPQAFRAAALRHAHESEQDGTDDAVLVERSGGRVVVVAGDARNLKVTVPSDLAVALVLLDDRDEGGST